MLKKKTHILNIVQRYHPAIGGAEIYMKNISESLVKDGCEATVFTTDAWDLEHLWKHGKRKIETRKEVHNGVRIERFHAIKFPFHAIVMRTLYHMPFLFSKSLFSLPSPVAPGIWKRLFFKNRDAFNAVHVAAFPYNSLIYMGMLYAKRHKLPLIVTPFLHLGEREGDKVSSYYTREFQVRLLSKCDKIVVQTSIERDYLKSAGIKEAKIYLLGQGVDPDDVRGGDAKRFRERFKIKEGKIVFHVSTKSFDKGTFYLIEAMKSIWEKNRDVKLVLAGPPMEEFNRYFSNQQGSVKDRCVVLDHVIGEDKRDLFAAGDVFALPSRTDSFGIVFFEAWANKKPVIGARAGGIPEVISNGDDGYLVRFGDVKDLADSIESLLSDKDLSRRMGEKGYAKVYNNFIWGEKYKIFKSIL